MENKKTFKQRIRLICLYTTLTAIVVGGLAMVRFLALSFVLVRYVLYFLLTKAIAHLFRNFEGMTTITLVLTSALNYLIGGFLFRFPHSKQYHCRPLDCNYPHIRLSSFYSFL